MIDERIKCETCRQRITEVGGVAMRAQHRYAVGNVAKPQWGHSMHFMPDGSQLALCAAKPNDPETVARRV